MYKKKLLIASLLFIGLGNNVYAKQSLTEHEKLIAQAVLNDDGNAYKQAQKKYAPKHKVRVNKQARKVAHNRVRRQPTPKPYVRPVQRPRYVKPLGYTPHAGRIDHRLKRVVYDIRNVVNLSGFYGFQTHIEFSRDEEIKHIAMGDSQAWQVAPNGNHLFIKPSADNADTNMTVLTNKRTYNFDLSAQKNKSRRQKNLTYSIYFVYPQDALRIKADKIKTQNLLTSINSTLLKKKLDKLNSSEIIPNRVFTPSEINWKYTRSGSDVLAPIRVFDDGEFTYFQFDEKKTIPAIFSVGYDGKESLINFHKKGNFYVVQRIAKQFSLRSDRIVSCVFNDSFTNKVRSEIPRKSGKGIFGMFKR